jgi:polysaccharide pyruvyl transferase WcaK-like protein
MRDNYSYNLLKNINIKSDIVLDPVFNEDRDVFNQNFLIKKIDSLDFSYKDLEDIDFE